MKSLRLLTGVHSGAQISLTPGEYRIGPDEGNDICVSDWDSADLQLSVDEEGVVRARSCEPEDSDHSVALVQDFVAVPYGNTVICVGPQDAQWPSDVDMLSGLWVKPAQAEAPAAGRGAASGRSTLRITGLTLVGTMVGSLLVAGVVLFGTQSSQAISTAPTTDALAERISTTLNGMGLIDLAAVSRGTSVVVQGMVASAAEDVAARTMLGRIGEHRVARNYDVAQDVVSSIQESLAIDGARVVYRGKGVFAISGNVPSMARFKEALDRVRKDLDGNVRRIDVAVKERSAPVASTEYSEMIAIGDVRYVETPDGVKHLYPASSRTSD